MSYLDPAVNPYDPASVDPDPGTLPLDEIIRRAFKGMALGLRVCLPAQVTAVRGNQTVDVQPTLQVRYIDQTSGSNIPPVQHVPVSMPMGAGYSIKLPVAVGDTGFLIFADRSLVSWLAGSGGIVDPQDSRSHDLSDAIFVPGLPPTANQTQDGTTDLVITNGAAKIRVQKAGTFVVTNGTNELLDLLDQLLDVMINKTFTMTIFGPMPFISSTDQLLTDIRTKLDTLKGS